MVGTKNGLNRYDGRRFEIYTNDADDPYSISNDWVLIIKEFGDYLLIGTMNGGTNLFHKKQKRFYQIQITEHIAKAHSFSSIHNLEMDQYGQLWILENYSGALVRLQFPENFWDNFPKEEELLEDITFTFVSGSRFVNLYIFKSSH